MRIFYVDLTGLYLTDNGTNGFVSKNRAVMPDFNLRDKVAEPLSF